MKMINKTLAIEAANPKPSSPATIATIKKIRLHIVVGGYAYITEGD